MQNSRFSVRTKTLALVIGGGRRDRTDDPLLAKQVLSQLSYAPMSTDLPQVPTAYRHGLLVSAKALTITDTSDNGGSGWIRTNDPRLIKTVL